MTGEGVWLYSHPWQRLACLPALHLAETKENIWMADLLGRQFGNYVLARLLGEGSFAQVYLGEHIYLRTQAAVKVLAPCLLYTAKNILLGGGS